MCVCFPQKRETPSRTASPIGVLPTLRRLLWGASFVGVLLLVAVDPPAKSLAFGGLVRKTPKYVPKS